MATMFLLRARPVRQAIDGRRRAPLLWLNWSLVPRLRACGGFGLETRYTRELRPERTIAL